MRDTDGGSSGGYGMCRRSPRRQDFTVEGWSQAVVSERNAGGESGAIRAVRYGALAGRRMMGVFVLRVGVSFAGFVGGW